MERVGRAVPGTCMVAADGEPACAGPPSLTKVLSNWKLRLRIRGRAFGDASTTRARRDQTTTTPSSAATAGDDHTDALLHRAGVTAAARPQRVQQPLDAVDVKQDSFPEVANGHRCHKYRTSAA